MDELIESYKKLKGALQKSAEITGDVIKLIEKSKLLENEGKEESEEAKEVLKKIEEKNDEFTLQMIKIVKLANQS